MSAISELRCAEWNCPACGTGASGSFCSNCGEKRLSRHDLSVHHLASHAAGELFHYDSKMFRSFRLLFTCPGFLTAEYLRGCRKRYLHPFQVFLIANLIYFFIQPFSGWSGLKGWLGVQTHMMFYSGLASRLAAHRMAAKGLTEMQLNRAFDHMVDLQARSLVILLVPLFAMLLWLLEWRKRRYAGEHLAFSLHFTAFMLITVYVGIFGGSTALVRLFADLGVRFRFSQQLVLGPLSFLVVWCYLFLALRRVYRDSKGAAFLKALVFVVAIDYIVDVYQFFLFLTALYSS